MACGQEVGRKEEGVGHKEEAQGRRRDYGGHGLKNPISRSRLMACSQGLDRKEEGVVTVGFDSQTLSAFRRFASAGQCAEVAMTVRAVGWSAWARGVVVKCMEWRCAMSCALSKLVKRHHAWQNASFTPIYGACKEVLRIDNALGHEYQQIELT